MTAYLAVQTGCTTVVLPGWAAAVAALSLAAPATARRILRSRSGGSP